MGNPTKTQAWEKLTAFDPTDNSGLDVIGDDKLPMSIDFTKSMISNNIWAELFSLADEQNLSEWRTKMFGGDIVNNTEGRAVGHVWLRGGEKPEVQDVLAQMKSFVEKTHSSGDFTDVVHIGIGGSDLGPRFVCDALRHLPKKMNVHFVANVDAADIEETLKPLNPKTTLVVIASKTFTTQETMMNANFAKKWLGDLDVAEHVIALSTNADAVADFGINTANMFPFRDWVGGRFSVWSPIGMPIALTYGFDVFQDFLNGGKAMDDHFRTKQNDENLPVLLALYGVWNRNFMHRPALSVLPYAQNLNLMCNFLQQLDMESNGKSVDRDGEFITDYKTGPIVFGQAGTNGQHAFHQWLHQGTDIVPIEFIKVLSTDYDQTHQHVLNSHADAQAKAFFEGEHNIDFKAKNYDGGRPSVTIQMNVLTAKSLGCLIAMYEHKIFVQGIIWNVNSFDQFGVELGKKLAKVILNKN